MSSDLCPTAAALVELVVSDEWKLDSKVKAGSGEVECYSRKVNWSPNSALMYKTFIPDVTPELVDKVLNGDGTLGQETNSLPFKDEPLLQKRTITKERGNGLYDLHSLYKSALYPIIGPRDTAVTCNIGTFLSEEHQAQYNLLVSPEERAKDGDFKPTVWVQGGHEIVGKEDQVPHVKTHVRCTVHQFGYVVQRVPGGITLTYAYSIDANGNIPIKVIEATAGKNGREKIVRMRQILIEANN